MQRKFGLMVLAAAVALVGLTGFAMDTVIAPKPLQAQACGPYSGKLCGKDCLRQCTDGSCCSILRYYYATPEDET